MCVHAHIKGDNICHLVYIVNCTIIYLFIYSHKNDDTIHFSGLSKIISNNILYPPNRGLRYDYITSFIAMYYQYKISNSGIHRFFSFILQFTVIEVFVILSHTTHLKHFSHSNMFIPTGALWPATLPWWSWLRGLHSAHADGCWGTRPLPWWWLPGGHSHCHGDDGRSQACQPMRWWMDAMKKAK